MGYLSTANVAPRAGAWIETVEFIRELAETEGVAPRAGAWIETGRPPSHSALQEDVAPRAGAWIESTGMFCVARQYSNGRSPCGSVD